MEALVDAIKSTAAGHNELSHETKEKVAALLNHPKLKTQTLPDNLECFASYNGKDPYILLLFHTHTSIFSPLTSQLLVFDDSFQMVFAII